MGVPPVNHAQDARATFKLHHFLRVYLVTAGGGGHRAAVKVGD